MSEIIERIAGLENDVETIKHDLYPNGQPGFINETRTYISEQRGMWKIILAIGILLGILQGIQTVRDFMRPIPATAQHAFEE